MDRQLDPLGRLAIAALAPKPGERILDVGCGSGQTSMQLAKAVAPGGRVLAIDISAPLLDVARRRAADVPEITFANGDAQVFPFEPSSFDALYSRFGVMFFSDPAAAFANLRRALAPAGRLAFVCWRPASENPVFTLPMAAALPHLPRPPEPSDPEAPGPFAFSRQERVREILDASGFVEVAITRHDLPIGGNALDAAVSLAFRMGPLGRILIADPTLRERVAAPVRAALAAHDGPDGVTLDARVWIVTARAP